MKDPSLKNLKVILVGHVTESYGPMQSLPEFLKERVKSLAVIAHPFPYCSIQSSKCQFSVSGKTQLYFGPKYKFKKFFVIHYLGDFLLTFYFVLRMRESWDLYIGSDCLNAFVGLVLRAMGIVKKVVFYEHEFTQKRFRKEILNKAFHFLNGFTARNVDFVWDSPPNLNKIRERQKVDLKKVISVPHGVDVKKIKSACQANRRTLVYVGHVMESKGLQLLVKAIEEVAPKVKGIKVAIVGSGPFEEELRRIIKRKKLERNFIFWGYTDHDWTLSYLPSCGIGLAPYAPLERQALMHAEPLKVKDYLSCGLPVIITHFVSCAKEINDKGYGLAVDYNWRQLAGAIEKLCLNSRFYNQCCRNIKDQYQRMSWTQTFNKAFKKTLS